MVRKTREAPHDPPARMPSPIAKPSAHAGAKRVATFDRRRATSRMALTATQLDATSKSPALTATETDAIDDTASPVVAPSQVNKQPRQIRVRRPTRTTSP